MIKQKQPYGCGLYAVANACNLKNFITEERLEASKKGNVIGQLFMDFLFLWALKTDLMCSFKKPLIEIRSHN
jgi:hypothetical protein